MLRLSYRTGTRTSTTSTLKTVVYSIAAAIAWVLTTVYYLLSR